MRTVFAKLCNGLSCPRGNVAVLFALMLPLIVGGAGLGVETTYWRYKQLQLQAAADAAAFAAGTEKRTGSDEADIAAAAAVATTQNGFAPSSVVVAVSYPASVNGVATPNAVQVSLQAQASRFFTAYFSAEPIQLGARATSNFAASGAACILALSPSASGAVLVSGSAAIQLDGCTVMANSVSATAVTSQGSSSISAGCLITAGGVQLSGAVSLGCGAPVTQAPQAVDPYRSLAAPSSSGACKSDSGGALQPGNYCSGMTITGAATLAPGVYVISGGDFRLNGGADISGSGVTIYLTGGARVRMNGNAEVNLSAPTSGPYAGILFYGDRAVTGLTNEFNGTAASRLTGSLYFPGQAVSYQGNFSGQGGCTQVVARTVAWSGSASVAADCSALGMSTVPVVSTVRLVG